VFVHKESWRPLHLPLSATSPIRETTLLREQVGESASSRLDADDRTARGLKSIKVLVRRAERRAQLVPWRLDVRALSNAVVLLDESFRFL
jgi:hypothetical protein